MYHLFVCTKVNARIRTLSGIDDAGLRSAVECNVMSTYKARKEGTHSQDLLTAREIENINYTTVYHFCVKYVLYSVFSSPQ